ncbi:primosomal protein N' [Aromatoleum toluolicum]|uniref:Replication restart protein PriA n=1 Tax=Aromatoleum toluolicum TaxID=90060 RepID=A0ABX1NES9_9RHOO|nr:primosomal protein N' [Aromatoleum toluolicum]NMF97776.1 primosomal protein N' [Aromatoleum toluolicum]
MSIVRVALPVPIPQLFDYSSQDACEEDVGRCVRVPFGRGEKSGVIVALVTASDVDPARLKAVRHIQREVAPLPRDWLELVAFVARYYHAPLGEVIALALPPGLRRADAVSDRESDPLLDLSADGHAALAEARRASRALALLGELRAAGVIRRSAARELPAGAALGDAMKRGWVVAVRGADPSQPAANRPELTDEQRAAVEAVSAGPEGFAPWLLQGVTGSGKTEVYLRLAERALAAGRQVLMLVPEIALTPQLESRVANRFPAACVVSLHSALAEGARSRGFVQALEGRADIVLGTRLSVFAPLPRLGLILVDEEHDASYKQQEGVRYSARDVAVWRAHQRKVPVVLGSATPSLESWQHARLARYRSLRLDARALASTLPTVRRIDTRRMKLDEGLSPQLKTAIGERLARGEQSLVFLNRRGYAPVLSCPACGWVSQCPHCSANLVVHLADRRLRCHHCGCDTEVPHHCPVCSNQDIQPFGRGTQRIEARLVELFPEARVLRVDRDSARTRNQWESLLAQIASGEADILVGTQMMAKGHDFPQLTLVGVIGADASLHAADFRAPERLFQQLMQVGGRAGRAHLPGEVLVQTEYPDHPLYRCLVKHDFDAFAASGLDERRAAGFPPFSFQAMLRADAPLLDDAMQFLAHARRLAQEMAPAGVRVFDAVPMRLTRLARRERAQLLVEADERAPLQGFLGAWIEVLRAQRTPRELRWQLDVDPLEV